MSNIKITELADAASSLSQDDLIVVVDINSQTTKKTTVGNLVAVGLPENIEANVSIRSNTSSILQNTILPIGELAYETDTNFLKIGDGNTSGGKILNPSSLSKLKTSPTTLNTVNYLPDPDLFVTIPQSYDGIFKLTAWCYFAGDSISISKNPPLVRLYGYESDDSTLYGFGVIPGKINISKLKIDNNTNLGGPHVASYLFIEDEKKSTLSLNDPNYNFIDPLSFYTIAGSNSNIGYLVEINNYITLNGLTSPPGKIGIMWACAVENTSVTLYRGFISISKV